MRQRVCAVLLRNQIFNVNIVIYDFNAGAAFIAELVANGKQLGANNFQLLLTAAQHIHQLMNAAFNFIVFIDELLTLQTGQTTQTHADDSLCLFFIQMERIFFLAVYDAEQSNLIDNKCLCNQVLLGFRLICRCADNGNDAVNIFRCNLQAL